MPMQQTTLTDQDRAILARLKLPALRNESRGDDLTCFLNMLARESINAYNAYWGLGHQSPRGLLFTAGMDSPGGLRAWLREKTQHGTLSPYWHKGG